MHVLGGSGIGVNGRDRSNMHVNALHESNTRVGVLKKSDIRVGVLKKCAECPKNSGPRVRVLFTVKEASQREKETNHFSCISK